MRKAVWIAVIIGVVAACGFGLKARAAAAADNAGWHARPTSLCPRRKTSPSASPTTRASGSSSTSTPRIRHQGCTIEAHNFQRDMAKYDALNAVVLGVSLDTVEGHKTWCAKDTFSFKLLADPDHKVVDAYGVPVKTHGDMKFAARDTFLISPAGKIVKVWEKVDPNVHSTEVLAEIEANKK